MDRQLDYSEKSIFTTKRLTIQKYSESQFENAFRLYSDPQLTRFFDHGAPRSEAETRSFLQKQSLEFDSKCMPYGVFSVSISESGEFIGHIDVVPTEEPGQVEIGWIFNASYQGKGFCTEAVSEFLIPYIELLSKKNTRVHDTVIREVVATAHPMNIPSQKVMYKVGLSPIKYGLRYNNNPRIWFKMELNT